METSARTLNLLHGVARLSAELGMAVVIEGVETEEQRRFRAGQFHWTPGAGQPRCAGIEQGFAHAHRSQGGHFGRRDAPGGCFAQPQGAVRRS
mgnify:CR=1 FL=1